MKRFNLIVLVLLIALIQTTRIEPTVDIESKDSPFEEIQLLDEAEDTVEEIVYLSCIDEEEYIPQYEELGTYYLTAYCSCHICCGKWAENRPKDEYGNEIVYTASGAVAYPEHTIAVDPNVIPIGSQVLIGDILYTAEDVGGSIKGNHIDVYFSSHSEARKFKVRNEIVYLLVS